MEEGKIIKVRRQWSEAQTPLERLCATGVLDAEQQARLQELRAQTNPRQLRREIYQLRDQLFDLPLARSPQDSWLIPDEDDDTLQN